MVKQAVWDGAVLCTLIILPMAFLGPGWRTQKPDARIANVRFQREHSTAEDASFQDPDRDIPLLRAFPKEPWYDDDKKN